MAEMQITVAVPTVHINGTKGGALLSHALACRSTLQGALQVLQEYGPNGRDFYPQGDAAVVRAFDEHRARLKAIEDVIRQYEEIAEGIERQLDHSSPTSSGGA